MKILVINAGSSSLKYQLFDMETEKVLAKGGCERIGISGSLLKAKGNGKEKVYERDMPDHKVAIKLVLEALLDSKIGVIKSMKEIDAVGHRVVASGEYFKKTTKVTPEVMKTLEEKTFELGPLHNPAAATGVRACMEVMPDTPMALVFDSSFHATMPPKAYLYGIDYDDYKKYAVRKYGAHGTSHKYVSQEAAKFLCKRPEELKIVTCHLGNGSSIAAVSGGRSVDTSMGFTPLAGLPMGTRSGDLDAGILQYLMNKYGWNIDEALNVLNKKSGVLGISGVSSDFRDIETARAAGNERAAAALEAFIYRVVKYIGAYTAAMNGVDAIAFTAGVGENDIKTRKAICEYLGYLGVKIDDEANNVRGERRVISSADSKVKVMLIPTNEELAIARETLRLTK